MSDNTRLMADVAWYGWSDYKEIRVVSADNGTTVTQAPQNYRNTISIGLGGEHSYSDKMTIRAGIQFDPTPSNDTDRSTRAADSDRTWVATGISYSLPKV